MSSLEPWLNCNARAVLASRNYPDFISYTKPDYVFKWFNEFICQKLDDFEQGKIKNLGLFVPPQHGKSELVSRRFPPYALGKNPDRKIALCSYNATIAAKFNRDMQRVIDDPKYKDVFPDTTLNASNVKTFGKGNYLRNSEEFEIVSHSGFVRTVGVRGPLTSTPVDIGIIDDPLKDRAEALSLTIRQSVWEWYVDVFLTRLHNDSQQLLIMTRWDQDDLAGRILKEYGEEWEVIELPAIKEEELNNYDKRQIGQVLWPEKHSKERILKVKVKNPVTFNSLYQQRPKPSNQILIFPNWKEVDSLPGISEPVYGVDFGYSNDVTAIIAVEKNGQDIYVDQIIYQTGLLTSDIIRILKQKNVNLDSVFVCDHKPDTIDELRVKGMNGMPAIKGAGSVAAGILFLKEFNIHYTKTSNWIKYETENYQFIAVGNIITNEPLDAFNHAMDAIRYAMYTLYHIDPQDPFLGVPQ